MKAQLEKLKKNGLQQLKKISEAAELEQFRVDFLGKKGELTGLLKQLGKLPASQRPQAGQQVNQLKQYFEEEIEKRRSDFQAQALTQSLNQQSVDISLPGRGLGQGNIHPISKVTQEICDIFGALGFATELGPEVEDDYHNFAALNIPEDHPARDMQDTFYVDGGWVMRTHTSPVQIRTMENQPPPVRIVAPGKAFRHDDDVTHSPVFHQVEGLYVDEGVSFAELKGDLSFFLRHLFGDKVKIRFRASFFPFTEPSAEVDIGCIFCRTQGCRICKGSGWLEILGAGMVDPNVFEAVGIDKEKYTGYAFGMGVERVAMLLYGVNDIRHFYENDLRFLRQF